MRWYFLFYLFLLNSVQNSFATDATQADRVSKLFNYTDPVHILTIENFTTQIEYKHYSQIVLFYENNTESDIYAPVYKKLAAKLLPSLDLVQFGVIDCSDFITKEIICWRVAGLTYPNVLYYGPYQSSGHNGKEIDMPETKEDVIYVLKDKKEYLFPIINITKFETYYEYEFSIFEDEWSLFGPEVKTDLYQNSHVHVRRGYTDSSAAIKLGIDEFPTTVGYSQKTQVPYQIARKNADVEDVEQKIREYVYEDRNKPVSYTDLELAIRTSLEIEVTNTFLAEEETQALLKYLDALIRYFPAKANLGPFLSDLSDSLEKKPEWNSTEVYNLIMNLENKHNPVFVAPPGAAYETCSGEDRGYPCALWLLFHTLLGHDDTLIPVTNPDNQVQGLEILKAMSGYTYHFQEDRHRALLFKNATETYHMTDVRDNQEARLWLWWVHNQIKKVDNDTNAPHPNRKLIYPTCEKCPMCYHNNWSKTDKKINYNTLSPCRICDAYKDAGLYRNWIIGDVHDYLQKQYGEGRIAKSRYE